MNNQLVIERIAKERYEEVFGHHAEVHPWETLRDSDKNVWLEFALRSMGRAALEDDVESVAMELYEDAKRRSEIARKEGRIISGLDESEYQKKWGDLSEKERSYYREKAYQRMGYKQEEEKPAVKRLLKEGDIDSFGISGSDANRVCEYNDAIKTMIDLRRQPGTEPFRNGKAQFVLCASFDMKEVWFEEWESLIKGGFISPCFESLESAQKAVEKIGKERILRMFRGIHHVEPLYRVTLTPKPNHEIEAMS